MYKNNFICAIKHNGRILREVGEEVCLPFGSQYSILLKNKDSRRALVDIEVDGEDVLSGNSLIVDGYTSQEIRGFMRNMSVTNRFKFIKKTKEISNYRGDRVDDGIVSVRYRFERRKPKPIIIPSEEWWPKYTYPKPSPGPKLDYDVTYASCNMASSPSIKGMEEPALYVSTPSPDEGITVKGSKITQNYQYGGIDTLEYNTYVITLRLKGISKRSKKIIKKPLTVKTKLQCSTCGRRSKSSATFCSNCGTYLR